MSIFNIEDKKEFKLKPEDIKELIEWDEPNGDGCFASNRITKDGYKVGYMVRNEPSPSMPDSGWYFFAGDEDDKYNSDPKNFNIYKLNTICNYDPDIIKHLHSKVGTVFIRIDDSNFELDDSSKKIFVTKQ